MTSSKLPYWKRLLYVFISSAVVYTGLYFYHKHQQLAPTPVPQTDVTYDSPSNTSNNSNANNDQQPIPTSLLIKVPFTVQAPTANWDELHNEACEEAVSIMANAYFNKIPALPAELVEQEITKLTQWQDQTQGYHLDQTSAEVSKMIESVYKLHVTTAPLSEAGIKRALTDNKLVIISFNGQLLNNPHYKQPGPIHHMLILTGWTADGHYITNDSGTKFGENYQYDFPTLRDAAADWDHSINSVDSSKKIMLIISN
ncbi:MAG TPA: hypothetical protein VHQ20_01340 [Patescibacteria group bacterium]|jgi:hypothetical protein|nr:hypothetical protein [Patescibacteria group bacterium]